LHERESRFGSSSSAALHAKTFAVDRERIFVGSFNFDPRSELINTEMGLVVDSAPLARQLAAAFDTEAPHTAYEVRLTAEGEIEWIEQTAGGEERYRTEPATSWLLRRQVDFLSILPIESLL
jgi:putative cardiolipin synthase